MLSIIHPLKLVGYLLVQTDKPWYNYYLVKFLKEDNFLWLLVCFPGWFSHSKGNFLSKENVAPYFIYESNNDEEQFDEGFHFFPLGLHYFPFFPHWVCTIFHFFLLFPTGSALFSTFSHWVCTIFHFFPLGLHYFPLFPTGSALLLRTLCPDIKIFYGESNNRGVQREVGWERQKMKRWHSFICPLFIAMVIYRMLALTL